MLLNSPPMGAWLGRFTKTMVSLRYTLSQGDYNLYIKHSQDDKLTILLVYVDDTIISGNNKLKRHNLKEKIFAQFEMKNLVKLKFLGIEVAYSPLTSLKKQEN